MGVEMARIVDNSKPYKSHEEREYLICTTDVSGYQTWEIKVGRTEAYNHIKDLLNQDDIDVNESFILVETQTLSGRKSIYEFMKYAQTLFDDGFDIDEFIRPEYDEEADKEYMDTMNNAERLDMSAIMNGIIDLH